MRVRMPAEWERQSGVLVAWPHSGTDWLPMLGQARACFGRFVALISQVEFVVLIAPDTVQAKSCLDGVEGVDPSRVRYVQVATNDTWTRDYGPITVVTPEGEYCLRDFQFDGWGGKYEAYLDNRVTLELCGKGVFNNNVNLLTIPHVLEGGSVESDGRGCVMTTSRCLLNPNRGGSGDRASVEELMADCLGAEKVLWLDHGQLAGDDTDGHIDTLARFAPGGAILYVCCADTSDQHYAELKEMERELRQLTDTEGKPFKLKRLPMPEPIYDSDGRRLPATYANFLVINSLVLVPSYGQPGTDAEAARVIGEAFPGRGVELVDCLPLIRQYGSLHCSTMQFPQDVIRL